MKINIKNKKIKGFTLIEILAIILILGVISFITFPIIRNIIEENRERSFRASLDGIVRAFELYMTESYITDDVSITYNNEALKKESSSFISGIIEYTGGLIFLEGFSDGEYCGNGLKGNYNVSKGSCENIQTPEACFVFNKTTKTITDYKYDGQTCPSDISIPSTIGGETVQFIGKSSFANKQLTSIILPNTITEIGESAFSDNGLQRLIIKKGVTVIGENAFINNQLESVLLPSTIETIGSYAFAYNYLTTISLPDTLKYISDGAFRNNQLRSINIPDSVTSIGSYAFYENELANAVISNNVTMINNQVFRYNLLTEVTIPDGVTSIGSSAFADNLLKNIVLPDSVTTIHEWAFYANRLTNIVFSKNLNNLKSAAFNDNQLPGEQDFIYARNGDGTIDKTTLVSYGGANRDNVVIPNTVKSIFTFALAFNNITDITIPTSVISIQPTAFSQNQLPEGQDFIYDRNSDGSVNRSKIISYGGANRDNVVIPDWVKTIGSNSFMGNNITSVTIPKSVTTIGYAAFMNNHITSITIPETVTSIEAGAFNLNKLPEDQAFIYARNSNGSIDTSTIVSYGGSSLDVDLPSGITKIAPFSFINLRLNSISIPSTVTSIGEGAFMNNDGITFNIDRATNKISGSPWGAVGATIKWTGSE